jgi:hypothetical protein
LGKFFPRPFSKVSFVLEILWGKATPPISQIKRKMGSHGLEGEPTTYDNVTCGKEERIVINKRGSPMTLQHETLPLGRGNRLKQFIFCIMVLGFLWRFGGSNFLDIEATSR